jgi:hypothetical protein
MPPSKFQAVKSAALALARFEATLCLIDHVDAPLASDDAVVAMAPTQ